MKNLRSYREMVGARYDHRLLLLVLPESCSLSLSFFHSLPRSMIASPFSTRTYLDRRNMATVCSVPLIKAHSLNCGLIKSPHYRKLPAPLLLEKSLFRISIDSIDDKKRWTFARGREKILKFIHPHKSIERRFKSPTKAQLERNWLPNNGVYKSEPSNTLFIIESVIPGHRLSVPPFAKDLSRCSKHATGGRNRSR